MRNGVIAEIGLLRGRTADRFIEAEGLNVAPGFVDLHTHYDSQIFWDPACSTSGWHGVTSVVIGNCGFGFAPVRPEDRDRAMLAMTRNEQVPLASMKAGMPWDWVSFPEFLDSVERTPKSINVLALMPLGPLMTWVMGLERAKAGVLPTDAEHAEMVRLLNEAMDAGACGISAQRLGVRSNQRDYDGEPMVTDVMHDETMLVLAAALGERNAGVIQYSYSDIEAAVAVVMGTSGDVSATKDVVHPHIEEVARIAGRPVIVGGAGERNGDWMRSVYAQGLRIYAMANTVTLQMSLEENLAVNMIEQPSAHDFSAEWARVTAGSAAEVKDRLSDPRIRQKMRTDLPLLEIVMGPMSQWKLWEAATPMYSRFNRMALSEIAAALGNDDLLDAFCSINVDEDLRTNWRYALQEGKGLFAPNLDEHKAIAADPYSIPGISDGGAHTRSITTGNYATVYLTTYVREHGWHTLEEAHWRLSALPAFVAGFKDRGTLVEGAPADIVVYDFEALGTSDAIRVDDFPGGEWRLVDEPSGYHFTLVNGEVTREHNRPTDLHTGMLLRHGHA
jgi:N-acyl-D-amino-acid deacylase